MKRKLIAVVMSALCMAAALPSASVMADGQKVVTLGADLSDEQRQMILKYFGVYGQSIETLTITNTDEREHLGSYVPLEQIGTKTYSCALVNPTTSGGIQVKTANLTWVTSNMIATTLSTSGVVNCDVLAAAPFEVSGTGALTGILMAYESASGETLDETKKETATQELITTTTIANNIGQVEATQIVNDTKKQVIENNVENTNDIDIIINEAAQADNVSLSDSDRELLKDLLEKISEQDYNYEDMSTTLDRVEENLNELINQEKDTAQGETSADAAQTEATTEAQETEASSEATEASSEAQTETQETLSDDSILMNTDDSALGNDAVFDATDSSALTESEKVVESEVQQSEAAAESEASSESQSETSSDASGELNITTSDSYSDTASDTTEAAQTESDTAQSDTESDTETVIGGAEGSTEINVTDSTETEAQSSTATEAITAADLLFIPNSVSADPDSQTGMAGLDYLTVKSPRADLTAGSGTLSLYSTADNSLVETITLNDTDKVTTEPITDSDELSKLGWTEGTEFRIYLSSPLAPGASYYVVLSDGAFVSIDGSASYQASDDASDASALSWSFSVSNSGIGLDETAKGVTAGTPVSGSIYLDSTNSAYAVIDSITADGTDVTASTVLDQNSFTENGTFQITFAQNGQTVIHVSYYDSADSMNLVSEATYTVTVK